MGNFNIRRIKKRTAAQKRKTDEITNYRAAKQTINRKRNHGNKKQGLNK